MTLQLDKKLAPRAEVVDAFSLPSASDGVGLGLLHAGTLALWMGCAAMVLGGMRLHYPRPHFAQEQPPPVVAEPLTVSTEVYSAAERVEASAPPSPSAEAAPLPAIPPLPSVAMPSPSIAFAVPVEGPAMVREAPLAVPVAPARVAPHSAAVGAARGAVRRLVLGVGEGNQPDPEYPVEAKLAGEQGVVEAQFTVDADGRVSHVHLARSTRWPLLNEAVLGVIRDKWRFAPGAVRHYVFGYEFRLIER